MVGCNRETYASSVSGRDPEEVIERANVLLDRYRTRPHRGLREIVLDTTVRYDPSRPYRFNYLVQSHREYVDGLESIRVGEVPRRGRCCSTKGVIPHFIFYCGAYGWVLPTSIVAAISDSTIVQEEYARLINHLPCMTVDRWDHLASSDERLCLKLARCSSSLIFSIAQVFYGRMFEHSGNMPKQLIGSGIGTLAALRLAGFMSVAAFSDIHRSLAKRSYRAFHILSDYVLGREAAALGVYVEDVTAERMVVRSRGSDVRVDVLDGWMSAHSNLVGSGEELRAERRALVPLFVEQVLEQPVAVVEAGASGLSSSPCARGGHRSVAFTSHWLWDDTHYGIRQVFEVLSELEALGLPVDWYGMNAAKVTHFLN